MVGCQGFQKCCECGSHCVKIFTVHLVRINESCFHLAHLDHRTSLIKPLFFFYGGCEMLSEWLLTFGRIVAPFSSRDKQAYLASVLSKQVLELVSDDAVYLQLLRH